MELLTQEQRERLVHQGKYNAYCRNTGQQEIDWKPVVKLFTPWGAAVWLLSELDPADPDIAFGLCDLGIGFPELGSVSLAELESVQGPCGLNVERDPQFVATQSLTAYAEEARIHQRIVA